MSERLEQLTAALAGRYTIEKELGQGGMATVYLAQDVRHHRAVAVKVLRPDLAAVRRLGLGRAVEAAEELERPIDQVDLHRRNRKGSWRAFRSRVGQNQKS